MKKLDRASMKLSGIYTIRFIDQDRNYVGSTVEFNERFNEHVRFLRNGNHHSERLQNFWNKYGPDKFEFVILEVLDREPEILRAREMVWMEKLNSCDRDMGFNIARDATRTRLASWQKDTAKTYVCVSPDGQIYQASNLNDFCLRNQLETRRMRKVARGALIHRKGWRCWVKGTEPNPIPNLTDFLQIHKREMKKKSSEFAHELTLRNCRVWYFKNEAGVVHEVKRLSTFCLEKALDITTMYEVGNGERDRHRGWYKAIPGMNTPQVSGPRSEDVVAPPNCLGDPGCQERFDH